MSKERARRREQRERAVAEQTAGRAAAQRRTERRRALVAPVADPVRRIRAALAPTRPNGVLAERRRNRTRLIFTALVFLQILVWIIRPDWQARLGALVFALIAFPVIAAFTL